MQNKWAGIKIKRQKLLQFFLYTSVLKKNDPCVLYNVDYIEKTQYKI